MSKHKHLVTSVITVLAGAGLLVIVGCSKKTEDKKSDDTRPEATKPAAKAIDNKTEGTPGVTATEIKIGQSMPYSGPASAFGVIGRGEAAYFKMINDKGGINGRKLTLISLDDGYVPAKALENVKKLVEGEQVAFIFNNVGTANNTAVRPYLNEKKVPQLFIATAADKWADPSHYPWTMGFAPSYASEARVYARYLLKEKPKAKLCVLYQNDDFGKDYMRGLKDGFGAHYDEIVTKTLTYEASDPTVDSQIVSLHGAGCDTLLTATGPKFATQSIRKVSDIGWKPLFLMSNTSVSRVAVFEPAGLDKSKGIITAGYIKDITDPALDNDAGLNEYRAFAKVYLTAENTNDGALVYAFGVAMALEKVLTQCGNDLSRENIMKQAANLSKVSIPVFVDGIVMNTSPTDFQPFSQMQLARFTGHHFEPFGELLTAD